MGWQVRSVRMHHSNFHRSLCGGVCVCACSVPSRYLYQVSSSLCVLRIELWSGANNSWLILLNTMWGTYLVRELNLICDTWPQAHHGLFGASAFETHVTFYIVAKSQGQCSGSFKQIKRPVPRLCWYTLMFACLYRALQQQQLGHSLVTGTCWKKV